MSLRTRVNNRPKGWKAAGLYFGVAFFFLVVVRIASAVWSSL